MSPLPERKETPDAYRPVIVPKAVKMISPGKQVERNDQEGIDSIRLLSSKPGKSIAHTTYQSVYSTDLQRTAKWYYKAFGFFITNINPTFAVVEMSPGRIICITMAVKQPLKLGFVTKNINALKRQLIKANIQIDAEEENLLSVKDPDGNTIVIRSGGYRMEHVQVSVPGLPFNRLTRVRLETRDEMHFIAKRIEDDFEFDRASEEVISLCKSRGISTTGEALIISECRHTGDAPPTKARPTKVEKVFACIAIPEPNDHPLPDGMEYVTIPHHDYTVFPIDYGVIDNLRTKIYELRTNFMSHCFTRPAGNFHVLEEYKDDHINLYVPYYWNGNEIREKANSEIFGGVKPYVEFSYCYLYAGDIQASTKWFQKTCGFLVLEITPQYAVLETTPGQILYLSKDPDSSKEFVLLATEDNIQILKNDLVDNDIALEEDFPHWLVFRDQDHNKIGVWAAKINLDVDYQIPDKVVHDTVRYYLDFKEELHFVIRSIADHSEYEAASELLIQECRKMGIVPQGDAVILSTFSKQVDAIFIGVPLLSKPSQILPELSEYIVIPAQEYTVYPIHKSMLEDQRTTQLATRVKNGKETLGRPEQFYIFEQYIDEDIIEAYIPYVWSNTD